MEHKDTYRAEQCTISCLDRGQTITRPGLIYINIHFNIILSSMPRPYELSRSHEFPLQNPVCNSTFSHRYTCLPQIILFDNCIIRITLGQRYKPWKSSIWILFQALFIVPIRPGYLPRHPPLEWSQSMFPPVYCVTRYEKTHSKCGSAFNFKSLFLI